MTSTRPHILLVSVDPDLEGRVREAGARCDATIRRADPDAAVAAVGSETPDLVLVDMAAAGAAEACQALRSGDGPCPPLQGLLRCGEEAPVALEAGADDFLLLPLDAALLARRLEQLERWSRCLAPLRDSRERLEAIEAVAGIGHWEYDRQAASFHLSAGARALLGIDAPSPLDLESFLGVAHPDDVAVMHGLLKQAIDHRKPAEAEHRIAGNGAGSRTIRHQAVPGERKPYAVLGVVTDITARRDEQDRSRFLAYRDVVTGLPNRRLFGDRLVQAVTEAHRTGRRLAVLHVGLQGFRELNDNFGADVGDQILKQAAKRLQSGLRATDTAARRKAARAESTMSRLGGHDFLLLLSDVGARFEPARAAERLCGVLGQPFDIGAAQMSVGVNVGIAVLPDDGADADTLLRNAAVAMSRARQAGGNRALFYSAEMNAGLTERLEAATDLARGVRAGEIVMHYQPVIDTRSRRILGVEALARWDHPERGLLPPDAFLPVAEESGLIVPLGRWGIEQAAAQWRRWLEAGVGPVEISLNLSPRELRDPTLPAAVLAVLEQEEVDPRYLRFEVPEDIFAPEDVAGRDAVRALRRLGCGIAIDDFGTGSSSLGKLREVEVDYLKIDRSFLARVPDEQDNTTLVQALVAMAHKLRFAVIAEGVETEQQLRFLEDLGCDAVQGLLLGEPVPAEELDGLLARRLERHGQAVVLPFRRRAVS